MKKDEAEKALKEIWLRLPKQNSIGTMDKCGDHFGLMFYSFIKNEHPELLSFKCAGDKYQVINCWVGRWQQIHCDKK